MNGAHDLGGMDGFGMIDRSHDDPTQINWPHDWEQTVFSLVLACGFQGKWNIDESRFAREQIDPAYYLNSSYYEHWLHGIEKLIVDKGLVTAEELDSGKATKKDQFTPVLAHRVAGILNKGGPTNLGADKSARYKIGNQVVIENQHSAKHTRMPRYIRGRRGIIVMHHGSHVFPDESANNGEKRPVHLYTVQFEGTELWGEQGCEPETKVCVDVFEPYIKGQ